MISTKFLWAPSGTTPVGSLRFDRRKTKEFSPYYDSSPYYESYDYDSTAEMILRSVLRVLFQKSERIFLKKYFSS